MKGSRKKLTAQELCAAGVSRELVVRKIRPESPKKLRPDLSEVAADDERGAR